MTTAAVIFALTYLVIGLQRVPRLHIGRPAGALLGAVAMVAWGVLDFESAKRAIDLDTILFLLGMMIVLAYLEMSGFFEVVERQVLGFAASATTLLWLVVGSAGLLSSSRHRASRTRCSATCWRPASWRAREWSWR